MYLLRIEKYVKEQVLQVVAIICKRGILENSHIIQESLLRDVTQLMSSNNREMVGAEGTCTFVVINYIRKSKSRLKWFVLQCILFSI